MRNAASTKERDRGLESAGSRWRRSPSGEGAETRTQVEKDPEK